LQFSQDHDRSSVTKAELPPERAIPADYGMAIEMTARDPYREAEAGKLAPYLLSPGTQALHAD
jgi:molybdate transport system substrate-binding protein